MDIHAFLIRAAIGPLWARWERSPYLRHYRLLRQTQYHDPETIRECQWQRLRALVAHAEATVPFYRQRFAEHALATRSIQNLEDWRRLPVLTKDDIRAAGPRLLSADYRGSKLRRRATSGSTGVSLEIFVNEDSMQWKRACTL